MSFTPLPAAIGFNIDGGVSAITTGTKIYFKVPFDISINSWELAADQSGSIVIDIWKDTYANFPPTVGDTMTGSEKPTLSNQQTNRDTNLTTWNTSVASGDYLVLHVDSATSVIKVNLLLGGRRF